MTNSSDFRDFNFSFALAQKTKTELEESHDKILERMTNIVDSEKFFINGFPVLKNIVALQPKKNDLKKLSKALDRLADLVEVFQELDSKLSVINTVQEHHHWFAWACGDFSHEVEQDIEKFFEITE